MHGKPRLKERRQFVQECNPLLLCNPAPHARNTGQTKAVLLPDAEHDLSLSGKGAYRRRCGLRRDCTAQRHTALATRMVGKMPHAIQPCARSAFSAISAVCIPCAAPLIMTEESCA